MDIQILYDSCMASKTINISLDEKLLKEIDKAAKAEFASRSDYIRQSLVNQLGRKDNFARELTQFMDTYDQDLKNLAKR